MTGPFVQSTSLPQPPPPPPPPLPLSNVEHPPSLAVKHSETGNSLPQTIKLPPLDEKNLKLSNNENVTLPPIQERSTTSSTSNEPNRQSLSLPSISPLSSVLPHQQQPLPTTTVLASTSLPTKVIPENLETKNPPPPAAAAASLLLSPESNKSLPQNSSAESSKTETKLPQIKTDNSNGISQNS